MLSFKKWIQSENLAGPGGGPEFNPDSQELLAKNQHAHGVGAFPSYGNSPINKNRTATSDYLDPRFKRKYMAKQNIVSASVDKQVKKSLSQKPSHD
jgi:hypothetical protein